MTFDRPQRPNRPQGAGQPPNPPTKGGGGGRNGGDRRGNGGDQGENRPPSPWLDHPLHPNGTPSTHATASFVEYLRWMRSPHTDAVNKKLDPTTQLQLMQMAEERAGYQNRLEKLNNRTKLLAGEGNLFEVTCPWRIRVGGTKGPENMLLPAFDALGMPYIPSSTLRGIARTYAICHFMKEEGMSWQEGDRRAERWFGHLDGKGDNRSGKVIFFDAYPTPSKNGGLAMDMANSLWRWEGDQLGGYSPNPNAFFSLKDVSFLIGIRPIKPEYADATQQVREWLIAGLAQGTGSQVNSGYGLLETNGSQIIVQAFLKLEFDVEGQKIHGVHRFSNLREPFKKKDGVLEIDREGKLKPDTLSQAEVRAPALKNIMRYWFRVFACGVLPSRHARTLEAQIFGGIEPKPTWGWLCVRVEEVNPPKDSRNTQSGILKLLITSSLPEEHAESFKVFCKELCWLMFRLGGIGQGARRPYYKRQSSPKIRGCDLTPYDDDRFWQVPEEPREFAEQFRNRLRSFYSSLASLANIQPPFQSQNVGNPTRDGWFEVADNHCRIFVFRGREQGNKAHALAVLHDHQFKHNGNYDRFLCGSTAMPSPVWIANVEDKDYQVVTIFGATQDPREKFVDELRRQGAIQIFPLTGGA